MSATLIQTFQPTPLAVTGPRIVSTLAERPHTRRERLARKPWSFDMPLVFALFIGAAMMANAVQAASDTSRLVRFTPACARQDLRAIAAIEEGGEIAGAPTGWLADAGLAFLQARILCRAGHEDEGIALYQSIIGFEAAVLSARKIIEQVRQ